MRVNLIGENGHIDALLLPRVAEGKYRFSQAGSGFLSIEALGGQWYLCCDINFFQKKKAVNRRLSFFAFH